MDSKRKPKYGIEPKYILMLWGLICICLIFFSYRFPGIFAPLQRTLNSCIVPMQKGVWIVGQQIDEFGDKFDDVAELQAKNRNLEKQVTDLKEKNERLEQELYDMERYKQLLELDEMYVEYPKVGANIIARDSSGFFASFTIDKGADDGMKVDMNVLADTGLVGIITEVGKNYSIVRSIIDDNSYLSATIMKTGDNCIVCGSLSLLAKGFIRVQDITINSQARNNYKVYTSELSNKYLPGILIGYLSNINNEADGMTKSAYLTPVVDFEHLTTVLVITQLKEPAVTPDGN
ncbi:MAG: rod shape-determining protein MreC [Lachnospiraceae bacterium]|nr:rod shape-determining protein MreC [Lachnospiraceae bacterium]